MKQKKFSTAIRAAFPHTIPVFAGYIVLGFGFGLLLQSKGYHFVWAFFMSVTIFAGSMQYVAVDLLASGASLITCAIMTLLINARHLFYGISMLGRYREIKKVKPYLIFGLTDETYGLVCSTEPPDNIDRSAFYFWITFLNHCYWITGCTLGTLFGQAIPINTRGVDYAMTALFTVILTDNLLKKSSRVPAVIGLTVSFICLQIFGSNNFLIPAMLGIAACLMLFRPLLEKENQDEPYNT